MRLCAHGTSIREAIAEAVRRPDTPTNSEAHLRANVQADASARAEANGSSYRGVPHLLAQLADRVDTE